MYKIQLQEYTWSSRHNWQEYTSMDKKYKKSEEIIGYIDLHENINFSTNEPYKYCVVHGHKTEFYNDIEEMYSESATTPCPGNSDFGLGCYELDGYIYKRI